MVVQEVLDLVPLAYLVHLVSWMVLPGWALMVQMRWVEVAHPVGATVVRLGPLVQEVVVVQRAFHQRT